MYLNLTQETCTGTGVTLTLTGATTGNNEFGKAGNGEDGQLVSCVVRDADGVVKVAGAYTFDKTANTLTRNDSWNDNGTTVDKNPSTNVALSAGTHTVSCEIVVSGVSQGVSHNIRRGAAGDVYMSPAGVGKGAFLDASSPLAADIIRALWCNVLSSITVGMIAIDVKTLAIGSTARFVIGLYVCRGASTVANLEWVSAEQDGSVDTGTTGNKVIPTVDVVIGVNDTYALGFLANEPGVYIFGTSNMPQTIGFGGTQTYGSGEPDSACDYTQAYSTTLPSTLDSTTGIIGDYRIPAGLLGAKSL